MSTYNKIYTLHKIQRKVDIYNSVIPCEKICEDLFWFFLQVFAGSFTSSFVGLHRFFTGWQVCCRFAKGAPNHLGWFGLQYIGKEVSPEQIQEIVALRGKESAASIRKRFGIGTTSLYKIWKGAAKENTAEPNKQEAIAANNNAVEPAEQEAIAAMRKLVSGMELLQQKIDVFLKGQESHFEDVEDLGNRLQELEENQKGILNAIEDSSNALREKADKIVSTTNAAKAVAYSLLKVVGIVVELLFILWLGIPIHRNLYNKALDTFRHMRL